MNIKYNKNSLVIFLVGFLLTVIPVFILFFSTSSKQKSSGEITQEAVSTKVSFSVTEEIGAENDFGAEEIQVDRELIDRGVVRSYIIKPGDSLWNIALENYSDPMVWQEIYELNKDVIGTNPDLIFPLTEIILPDKIMNAPK